MEVPRRLSAPVERLVLSVTEAGQLLGIGKSLAYDLVNQGVIPSIRLGTRRVVPRKALEEWLEREAARSSRRRIA